MVDQSVARKSVPSLQSLHPGALIVRGIVSVLFGILAFAWPGPGLLAIALLYGAYAFSDGIIAIVTGARRGRHGESWGLPIFEGVLGIAAGVITFISPGITLFALSLLVGFWAITTGVLEIIAAIKLHSFFTGVRASVPGRILLGLAGVFSVFLGLGILLTPALGAITLLTLVASYALIFGFLMIALGAHLRGEQRRDAEKREISRAA